MMDNFSFHCRQAEILWWEILMIIEHFHFYIRLSTDLSITDDVSGPQQSQQDK